MRRLLGLVVMFAALFILAMPMAATPAAAAKRKSGPPKYMYSEGCLPAKVKGMLSTVRKKFGPIQVVSTNRPGARILGSGNKSYHSSCRAADFNPPKGKYKQVVAFLKSNWSGGVGTYSCNFHHIHIDNGPKVRFHRCQ
jgi:uncharacterized protein YcbK (DUF882 family)